MQEAAKKLAPSNRPRPKWSLWSRVLTAIALAFFAITLPSLIRGIFGLHNVQYMFGRILPPSPARQPGQTAAPDQEYAFVGRCIYATSVFGTLRIGSYAENSFWNRSEGVVRNVVKPGWSVYQVEREGTGWPKYLPLFEFHDVRNWRFLGFEAFSPTPDRQDIVFPLYVLIPITAPALPIFLLRRRRLQRWRNNQCYHCGYPRPAMDAALEASHKCSECGRTDESDSPSRSGPATKSAPSTSPTPPA